MKQVFFLFVVLCCGFLNLKAQEWMHFTADDGIGTFYLDAEQLWTVGGSGLSQIDVNNLQTTTWSTVNSGLPAYGYDVMTVDQNGMVWLGGFSESHLTTFDGTSFNQVDDLLGYPITGLLDLKAGPDGKVWIFGYFEPDPLNDINLFVQESGNYSLVSPPSGLEFQTGTAAQLGVTADAHLWCLLRDPDIDHRLIGEFDGTDWILHDVAANGGVTLWPGDQFVGDSQGNLYVGVGSSTGPNFLQYDGTDWTYATAPIPNNTFANQQRALYMDANDVLWVCPRENTVLQYDGQDWTTIDLASYGLTDGYADGIFVDPAGQQWIYFNDDPTGYSFPKRSIYRYDGTSAQVLELGNAELSSNWNSQILIDDQNNKWFASLQNLTKFDGQEWETLGLPTGSQSHHLYHTDPAGQLWYLPGNSKVGRYDGLTYTEFPVFNTAGLPYDWLSDLAIDGAGVVYLATTEPEILVYDQGNSTYLTNMQTDFGGFPVEDVSLHVGLGPNDELYNLGYSLNRHTGNDNWLQIPQAPNQDFANDFVVAPDGDIYQSMGVSLPGSSPGFGIYDGSAWSDFASPFQNISYPQWDSNGNLWMSTEQGLCKENGGNWTCYNRSNSPLVAGTIDAFKIDAHDNFWIALKGAGILVFNENEIQNLEGIELPALSGFIYRDYNQNETLDPEDLPLPQQKVLLLPENRVTFTNSDGSYRFAAPPGDYQVVYLPISPWEIDNSPAQYDVSLSSGTEEGFDFRLEPSMEVVNLQVHLTEGFPRCNQLSNYWIDYWNLGTQAEDGQVRLHLDPTIGLSAAFPAPSFQDQDTLVWVFDDLQPFAAENIHLQLQMPDESLAGTSLLSEVYIDNATARLDTSTAAQILLCAYDPNDKIGRSEGEIQDGQSLLADFLNYTVRFQNTGNDTAFQVVIRDTLDAQLDWSTLEIVGASHPVETTLREGGALEFLFQDILLPDSNINEIASHGYVSYRIKALAGLLPPVSIENTAYIYFDLNAAIVTNTTVNVLVDKFTGLLEVHQALTFSAMPNPTDGRLQVQLPPDEERLRYELSDSQGRVLLTGQWTTNTPSLDLSPYPPGLYWLTLRGTSRSGCTKIIRH